MRCALGAATVHRAIDPVAPDCEIGFAVGKHFGLSPMPLVRATCIELAAVLSPVLHDRVIAGHHQVKEYYEDERDYIKGTHKQCACENPDNGKWPKDEHGDDLW